MFLLKRQKRNVTRHPCSIMVISSMWHTVDEDSWETVYCLTVAITKDQRFHVLWLVFCSGAFSWSGRDLCDVIWRWAPTEQWSVPWAVACLTALFVEDPSNRNRGLSQGYNPSENMLQLNYIIRLHYPVWVNWSKLTTSTIPGVNRQVHAKSRRFPTVGFG